MSCIYALSDPRTEEIRYVGQTRQQLDHRLKQHIGSSKTNRRRHLDCWIRKIRSEGVDPIILVLARVSQEQSDLDTQEIFWITYLTSLGFNLCNATAGGFGGGSKNPSDVTRQKLSTQSRKNWLDPAYRGIQLKRLQNCPDSTREKISAVTRSFWDDPLWAEKQRAILSTDEYRAKRSVIAKEIFSRKRKCAECDRISSPQNLGRHQKSTGHRGYVNVSEVDN